MRTNDKVKRLIDKWGSVALACWAIENRAIRCKTAIAESRLFYLCEAVDQYGKGYVYDHNKLQWIKTIK